MNIRNSNTQGIAEFRIDFEEWKHANKFELTSVTCYNGIEVFVRILKFIGLGAFGVFWIFVCIAYF